jgi:hypothetical protein
LSSIPDPLEGVPVNYLWGIRAIEKSPFIDEPDVYCFGGFAVAWEYVKNTAWIYKAIKNTCGSLPEIIGTSSDINIYPNPSDETVNVDLTECKPLDAKLIIYYSMAQISRPESPENTQNYIDISNLNSGFYFFIIEDQGRRLIAKSTPHSSPLSRRLSNLAPLQERTLHHFSGEFSFYPDNRYCLVQCS